MAQEWEPGKYLLIDYAGDKILLNSSRSNAVKLPYLCRSSSF